MTLVIAAIGGVVLGVLYVAALLWNVRLYLAGSRGPGIALHVLRLFAFAGPMWLAVRHGAGALLATVMGFLVAVFVAARVGVRRCR
jgi:F1F0 ATPase subunit 2